MATNKLKAAILIISQTASENPSSDKTIPILQDAFAAAGEQWEVAETQIVTDSVLDIQRAIQQRTDREDPINVIVTSGGTGFAVKDVTPEVRYLEGLLEHFISNVATGCQSAHSPTCLGTCVRLSI